MGRDLLEQDYLLKQLTSSLMFPEGEPGRKFWSEIYRQARETFGTTDIPVDSFNKVWIVPAKATVFETRSGAYVVESKLKVMLETDYVAASRHPERSEGSQHSLGSVNGSQQSKYWRCFGQSPQHDGVDCTERC